MRHKSFYPGLKLGYQAPRVEFFLPGSAITTTSDEDKSAGFEEMTDDGESFIW